MESDPAPFIANLFLYVYENRYMNWLKKSDLSRARNLRHVFRFIADLIAINDNDEFLKSYKEIYPLADGTQGGKLSYYQGLSSRY